MASSTPSDLGKLTVPQLKALCKERRITGYSKLSKAALLQKLAGTVLPVAATSKPPPNHANGSANVTPNDPAYIVPSSARGERNIAPGTAVLEPVPQPLTESTDRTSAAAHSLISTRPQSKSSIATSTRETPTKRPAHTGTSVPSKRIKTSLKPTTSTAALSHEPPAPRNAPRENLPLAIDSAVFKVPELPVRSQRSSFYTGAATAVKRPPVSGVNRPVVHRQSTSAGRFKPLLPSTPKPSEPDHATTPTTPVAPRQVDSALFDEDCANVHVRAMRALPVLPLISFPPRASERKWVYRWAIILSALSPVDRQTCTLVSRTFRYAVYLSATHILSRDFPGRRLDALLERHPRNMTNFWPYLRFRREEVFERRRAFRRSFLGQYTSSMGLCDPLSARLWTNPDDEKQVEVALRFVLTRMWFAVSVGAYGHDASAWSTSVVQDVREVVQGEIWQVTASSATQKKGDVGTGTRTGEEIGRFYVLEATCEVIGRSSPSSNESSSQLGGKVAEDHQHGCRLRADWSAWISQRAPGPSSLLECVKWSNNEDYHHGISKAWLRRIQEGRDAESVAKGIVAERYIFASVVANGISGKWMSTSAMAQEFAGLPDASSALGSRTVGRAMNTVNMYLAAHHHIESVHFETSGGDALHRAVAVIQTPGRGYYVLRDNGMQVGCEEEGIPTVWQNIIGCNYLGCVN